MAHLARLAHSALRRSLLHDSTAWLLPQAYAVSSGQLGAATASPISDPPAPSGTRPLHVWQGPCLSPQPAVAAAAQPSPALRPATPSYTVKVAIKAFEPRYLDQARTTLSDLMLIHFAPKDASQPSIDSSSTASPSNLSMPLLRDVPLNWKKTRFTVVKSPHIDKFGQESFELRKYKAEAEITTTDPQEVQWFLDSLRLYQFPGVQIQVILTNQGYLTPTQLTPGQDLGPQAGILAAHKQHISQHIRQLPSGDSRLSAGVGQQGAGTSHADAGSVLRVVRRVLYAGLRDQRERVGGSPAYGNWHSAEKAKGAVSQLTRPAPADAEGPLLADALHGDRGANQRSQSPARGGAAGAGGDADVSEHARHAAAFLAAADAAFLSLDLGRLESYKQYPLHFTTYRVGEQEVSGVFVCIVHTNTQTHIHTYTHTHTHTHTHTGTYYIHILAARKPQTSHTEQRATYEQTRQCRVWTRADMRTARAVQPTEIAVVRLSPQVPAAEWMQGVLQVTQTATALESARQSEQLTSLYARYSLFAHALLSTAIRLWSQQTAGEMKAHLALPPQNLVETFMADTI